MTNFSYTGGYLEEIGQGARLDLMGRSLYR